MDSEQFHWLPDSGWNPPLASKVAQTAQIVFLFGSFEIVSSPEWLGHVRRTFPQAHIVGCTTGGEIHGVRVSDDTAVVTAVYLRKSSIQTTLVRVEGEEASYRAGKQLIEQLDPVGLRHVFIVSDGLLVNGSDLLAGVNEALPTGVSASGGFAGDGHRFERAWVWCDTAPAQSTAVAIGFYGADLRIGLSSTGGWGPFGPDRLVTRAHKNVLYEVDGRPVLALFKEYLGEYASQLPSVGLLYPLELRDPKGETRYLRSLLGIDEAEQSIKFAGNIREGWLSRFMVGDIEDLISGTPAAARQSWPVAGLIPPELSLIVSCAGRRAVLKQRVEEEVDGVREVFGTSTALAGFYSYGEIAAGGFRTACELHNETMSITSLSEV